MPRTKPGASAAVAVLLAACRSTDVASVPAKAGPHASDAPATSRLMVANDAVIDIVRATRAPRDQYNPAAARGAVLYIADGQDLVARDVAHGRDLWRKAMLEDKGLRSLPRGLAADDTVVYVVGGEAIAGFDARSAALRFIKPVANGPRENPTVVDGGAIVRTGDADLVLIDASGQLTSVARPPMPSPPDLANDGKPAALYTLHVFGSTHGACIDYFQGNNRLVRCLDAHGNERWHPSWVHYETGVAMQMNVMAVTDTHVLVSTTDNANYTNHSVVLRASDGTPEQTLDSRASGAFVEDDRGALLGMLTYASEAITLERPDGTTAWKLPSETAGPVTAIRAGSDLVLTNAMAEGARTLDIVRVELATGTPRWRKHIDLPSSTEAMLGAIELVIAGDHLGVHCSLRDQHDATFVLALATGDVLLSAD